MSCPRDEELIDALLDPDSAVRSGVSAHLEGCADCREIHRRLAVNLLSVATSEGDDRPALLPTPEYQVDRAHPTTNDLLDHVRGQGDLSESQRGEIDLHISVCGECRLVADMVRRLPPRELRRLAAPRTGRTIRGFWLRVREAAASLVAQPIPAMAVATAVAVLAVAGIYRSGWVGEDGAAEPGRIASMPQEAPSLPEPAGSLAEAVPARPGPADIDTDTRSELAQTVPVPETDSSNLSEAVEGTASPDSSEPTGSVTLLAMLDPDHLPVYRAPSAPDTWSMGYIELGNVRAADGGTTADGTRANRPRAQAPDHVARSATASPTLWWTLAEPIDVALRLQLSSRDAGDSASIRLSGPFERGLHSASLAEHGIALQRNALYDWTIVAEWEPFQPDANPGTGGRIRYVAPEAGAAAAFRNAADPRKPALYAESGYWYDAFSFVARASIEHPDEEGFASLLDSLLASGGQKVEPVR